MNCIIDAGTRSSKRSVLVGAELCFATGASDQLENGAARM